MSASDLLDKIERTLRAMGRIAPAVEADVFLYHFSRICGGEDFRVPKLYAEHSDRRRMTHQLQGLPVPTIAQRVGVCPRTVYGILGASRRKSRKKIKPCCATQEDTTYPKEPSEEV